MLDETSSEDAYSVETQKAWEGACDNLEAIGDVDRGDMATALMRIAAMLDRSSKTCVAGQDKAYLGGLPELVVEALRAMQTFGPVCWLLFIIVDASHNHEKNANAFAEAGAISVICSLLDAWPRNIKLQQACLYAIGGLLDSVKVETWLSDMHVIKDHVLRPLSWCDNRLLHLLGHKICCRLHEQETTIANEQLLMAGLVSKEESPLTTDGDSETLSPKTVDEQERPGELMDGVASASDSEAWWSGAPTPPYFNDSDVLSLSNAATPQDTPTVQKRAEHYRLDWESFDCNTPSPCESRASLENEYDNATLETLVDFGAKLVEPLTRISALLDSRSKAAPVAQNSAQVEELPELVVRALRCVHHMRAPMCKLLLIAGDAACCHASNALAFIAAGAATELRFLFDEWHGDFQVLQACFHVIGNLVTASKEVLPSLIEAGIYNCIVRAIGAHANQQFKHTGSRLLRSFEGNGDVKDPVPSQCDAGCADELSWLYEMVSWENVDSTDDRQGWGRTEVS